MTHCLSIPCSLVNGQDSVYEFPQGLWRFGATKFDAGGIYIVRKEEYISTSGLSVYYYDIWNSEVTEVELYLTYDSFFEHENIESPICQNGRAEEAYMIHCVKEEAVQSYLNDGRTIAELTDYLEQRKNSNFKYYEKQSKYLPLGHEFEI